MRTRQMLMIFAGTLFCCLGVAHAGQAETEAVWSGKPVSPEAACKIGWPQVNGPTGNLIPLPTTTPLLDDLSLGRTVWISESTDFGAAKTGSKGLHGDRYEMRLGVDGVRKPGEHFGNWSGPIVYEGLVFGQSFIPTGEVFTGKWQGQQVKYHIEADEVVVAVDAKTGKTVWRAVESGGMTAGGGKRAGFQVGMAAADNKVFAMGVTGRLFAYDIKTGKRLWSLDPIASPFATPALTRIDGKTYVLVGGATKGALSLIDPKGGKVLWTVDGLGSNISNLSTDGKYVLVNVAPIKRDQRNGYWGCYQYDLKGAKRLWVFPQKPGYMVRLPLASGGHTRYLIRDGIVYAACYGDKEIPGKFLVVDAATGKELASHSGGHKDADSILEMFYLVGEDRLWVRSDHSHGPTHGGRHPMLPWKVGPDGIKRLDDKYGMCGADTVEFTTAYETLMEAPIVDGRKFERVGGGRVACVDLRKFPDDKTWQLKLEGGWIGSPKPLPAQLRVVGGEEILIGKCYPPDAATVGLPYGLQRREPGWQAFATARLRIDQGEIHGDARLSSGTDDSLPMDLDLKANVTTGRIQGFWARKVAATKETQKMEGKVVNGGWDAKRVFIPTPWLKHINQARTYFGPVPEGGRCVALTIDPLIMQGEKPKGMTLVLVHDGKGFVSAAAVALGFNQAWHEVDASKLSLKGDKVTGQVTVIVHGDKWVPARYPDTSREPKAGRVTIDVSLAKDGGVTGSAEAVWGVAYETKGRISGEVKPTR